MSDILFLAHRIPFPPDRGDKIRSHHLLRGLAELAPVHVGCFADTSDDWAQQDALAEVAASHKLMHRAKPLWRAGVEALFKGAPVSLTAFDSPELREWVKETIKAHEIDTIFVFSGQMAQYVPASFSGRVVVDLCDVDSAKFEAYGMAGSGVRGWIDRREGAVLAGEEARISARADDVLLISEQEAALFRSRLPDFEEPRISVLRNGIDHHHFDPAKVPPQAEMAAAPSPRLVFTGQMDYAPNIAAAKRVIRSVLPAVRSLFPEASFHIVGRAPTAELRAYDGRAGVRVWGEVPDTRPFLASADIVLAPLDIARGVQNKVLEAMAMARPVVLTSGAATGINAEDQKHFAVQDSDAGLAAQICALWEAPRRREDMGRAAREFVLAEQSWPAMLEPLAHLVGRACRSDGGAGAKSRKRAGSSMKNTASHRDAA